MTFVIITAGIDLSVGAMLGLNSVLTAMLMTTAKLGLVPTLLVVLAAGTAFGALQGLISIRFRLEPFIVTLAGLQMARGLALILSGNVYINISYGDGPGLAPPVFALLGDRLFHNVVPVATLVFVRCRRRRDRRPELHPLRALRLRGRRQRARGAAVGHPVARVKVAVFAITGFASARPASSMPDNSISAAPTTAPATN